MSENGSTYELLFSEFQLGRLRLRNRMVGLPHGTAHIQLGVPDDEDLAYWERRAKGGAALITVGGSIVHPTTRLLNRWLNEVYNPAAFSHQGDSGALIVTPEQAVGGLPSERGGVELPALIGVARPTWCGLGGWRAARRTVPGPRVRRLRREVLCRRAVRRFAETG